MAWQVFDQNGALLTTAGSGGGAVSSVNGTASEITVSPTTGAAIVGIADNPIIPGLEGMVLPTGTTAERPLVPVEGTVRMNTSITGIESYYGGTWNHIASTGGQTENFTWRFDTATTATDPGAGKFKMNNVSQALVTSLYLDKETSDGFDIDNVFGIIKGNWLIYFQDTDDSTKFTTFSFVAEQLVNNTGWWTMPVTFIQAGAGGLPGNNQKCTFLIINKNATPSSQGNTGALTYAGMTAASTTTVNIGALTGWVVNNETNPAAPTQTYINYPGASGVTVPTIGSGQISYLLMLPDGAGSATLVWQNSFPTSAQRKTHIYASKASHPNLATLGVVGNETDYITSPIGLTRDFFQAVNYVNNGIHATASSPGLTFATSAGKIVGDGINFYLDRTNPNEIIRGASNPTNFFYRTQIGGATGAVTLIDPTMYDVAGTITAIGGSSNQATIQYIYAIPFNGAIGFVVQYGQTLYASLALATTNVGKENPVVFPNLVRDAILIGFLCVQKGCTDLTITTTAIFFKADIFGQAAGGSGGTSVSTLQNAYNNSGVVDPQILTSTANDGVKIRRGSAADTDFLLVGQNGAGTNTFTVSGNGAIVATQETNPIYIGGTAAASNLELRATSGVGVGSEYIKFTRGNNGASESARIDGSGNLLIGGTAQVNTEILSLQRNSNTSSQLAISNTNAGASASSMINLHNGAANAILTFGGPSSSTTVTQQANWLTIYANNGGVRQYIPNGASLFYSWNNIANGELMRLSNSGNLGIGMTPLYSLDITKNQDGPTVARITNSSVGVTTQASFAAGNGTSSLGFGMLGTGYTTSSWTVQDGAHLSTSGSGGMSIAAYHASGVLRFITGGNNEKMRMDASGNLMIGTATSTGSDYIFELTRNTNSNLIALIKNTSGGASATNQWRQVNDAGNAGSFVLYGSGVASSSYEGANNTVFINLGGDLGLASLTTNKNIRFWLNGTTQVMNVYNTGLYIGGSTNATARLHIAAGTATANTAPFKLTSGTNLTTAETGAMEYNGTNLFFTRTGTTRESVITANAVNSVSPTAPNRTITVVIDGTTYYLHAKTTND